jgi:ATP-binding cassette subfamily F protein uup
MDNGQAKHVVSYMKDFLFSPEQARTPLGKLSGGERGRLMLAQALAKPSNLLVLDEPTNDLDMETLDVLEETISDYPGTVLLISHDRDFLDRLVSGVIVPEGDGRWTEYAGGYSDMLKQRGEDLSRSAAKEAPKAEAPKPDKAAPNKPAAKQKLSFKHKHALETLPKTMAALQKKIQKLQDTLHDPDLYARDRARFDTASSALTAAQTELATAEERWLALEILREEIEG